MKQVQSFLGFRNFYRKFIRYYVNIAWSLNNLTKKDHPWNWTGNCQQAFDNLKAAFIEAPILLMPDTTKPFVVESDALKWATGGVLWQQDDNKAGFLASYHDVHSHKVVEAFLCWSLCPQQHVWSTATAGIALFSNYWAVSIELESWEFLDCLWSRPPTTVGYPLSWKNGSPLE